MFSVIIKRRTLTLIIMGAFGLLLLFAGLRGGLFEKKSSEQGMPVSQPAVGGVSIEDATPQQFFESKMEKVSTDAVKESSDFFVEYRLERDRTRGQRIEWLREVINNANSAGETRQKAQEHLMAISRSMEKESELENLIRAKGFDDAAVMVDESTATAIVAAGSLSSVEVASITELVSRGTGMEQQKIAVINKN